jgi:hypothetical protein
MAKDLIFGKTKRNWSRGACATPSSTPPPVSDEVTLRLTEPEMAMLAYLAATKMRADLGDREAGKKMRDMAKKVARLQKQSKRGDAGAKRALLVLAESGVFRGTQSFTLGEALVPNTTYRATILRQAMKVAGGGRPSTKDFFRAKSAVDRAMDQAGVALYLPGSRPGRATAGWR